jgi:hypothetical protein
MKNGLKFAHATRCAPGEHAQEQTVRRIWCKAAGQQMIDQSIFALNNGSLSRVLAQATQSRAQLFQM